MTTKRITTNNFHLQTGHFGDNVRYEALAEELLVTGQSSNLFLRIRLRLEKTLEAGMDETPAEVTKALLLGSTSGIDEGLYENIRRGGGAPRAGPPRGDHISV